MTGAGTALLLTGGHSHPAAYSQAPLTALLDEVGLDAVVTDDIEAGLAGLAAADHQLLVVNALRWTMGHRRYDEHRDRWGLSLAPAARRGLLDWIDRGRPLLALHTALVCFDDWPEWGAVLGGAWDWDRSHHPPIGPVTVHPEPGPAVTAGLDDFTVTDECYVDLRLFPGNELVATATAAGCERQPVCWVRRGAGGRVAASTLGHDARSLDDPDHRALLARLIGWLRAGERVGTTRDRGTGRRAP
jgi:type 1 glutamine amidotransferase